MSCLQTLSNVIQRIDDCEDVAHISLTYTSAFVSQISQGLWMKGVVSPAPLSVMMRALKVQVLGEDDCSVNRVLATPQSFLRHLLESTHLLLSELFWACEV